MDYKVDISAMKMDELLLPHMETSQLPYLKINILHGLLAPLLLMPSPLFKTVLAHFPILQTPKSDTIPCLFKTCEEGSCAQGFLQRFWCCFIQWFLVQRGEQVAHKV